jgi:hypothetical protein
LSETVRRCDEGIFAVNSSAIYQKIAEVSIKKNQFLAKRNKFKQFHIINYPRRMLVNTSPKKRSKKIPETLVYEVLNGRPLYRKGYKEVLRKNLNPENIMGSS